MKESDLSLCAIHPGIQITGYASFSVPVYRASTIVFDDAQSYRQRATRNPDGYTYGLAGTPTVKTLETQLAALYGAVRTLAVPSGLAAISMLMLTVLKNGDRVMIPDNVYPPVKSFAREVLLNMGISSDIYDSTDLEDIARKIKPGKTRLVWVESPGSTTMEIGDIPAICALAHQAGALVGCDNTWGTALLCKPLSLGVDVVAEALTKYVGGHSDLLLGAISFAHIDLYAKVRNTLNNLGIGVSPDECSLALRGIETMALRLKHVGEVALTFARQLQQYDCYQAVLHPGLESFPGHSLWKRDFSGTAGVFSLKLVGVADAVIDSALDSLETIAIGASWGGTRSLIAPMSLVNDRQITPHSADITYLRISIGLESPEALWHDLMRLTQRLSA